MGKGGNAAFGLTPLGDIDDGDKVAVTPLERHPPPEGQDVDFAAVGLDVPPVTGGLIGLTDMQQRFLVADPLVFGPDFIELHREKFLAGVAVVLDRRVVYDEKTG